MPYQSFLILCHWRNVSGLCMFYKVNYNSNDSFFSYCLLLPEFYITDRRPQLIHWSLKYQCVGRSNLQAVSCQLWFECGMTFPTLCSTTERWMGLREQSTVGCFPESCFLQFSVAQVLVGLRKQLINNMFSPWFCVINNNNNNKKEIINTNK